MPKERTLNYSDADLNVDHDAICQILDECKEENGVETALEVGVNCLIAFAAENKLTAQDLAETFQSCVRELVFD